MAKKTLQTKEKPRYKADFIKATRPMEEGHFRITDSESDSRVATCFLKENADMVVAGLNMLEGLRKTTKMIERIHRSR